MVATCNAARSPFWENMRSAQVRDAVRETMRHMTPAEDVLYQSLIMKLLRDQGREDAVCEERMEFDLHRDLAHSTCWYNLGDKVSLMRFMDFPRKCADFDKHWHTVLYGQLTALLLSGALSRTTKGQLGAAMRKASEALDEQGEKKSLKVADKDRW